MLRDQITITELEVLLYIQQPHRLTEIAKQFRYGRNTVVVYISRLRRRGFVKQSEYVRDPQYRLTEEGCKFLNEISAMIQ